MAVKKYENKMIKNLHVTLVLSKFDLMIRFKNHSIFEIWGKSNIHQKYIIMELIELFIEELEKDNLSRDQKIRMIRKWVENMRRLHIKQFSHEIHIKLN